MSKVTWKSGTFIYPLPAVMVSCGTMEESNIITVAWTGIINTDPAMCYISVRPTRHSYEMIKKTGEFVINLTTKDLAYATDWCGVKTGAKVDKFKEMKLTKEKANFVNCPMIKESPVSVECKVKVIKKLRDCNYEGPITLEPCYRYDYLNLTLDEFYKKAYEVGKKISNMFD